MFQPSPKEQEYFLQFVIRAMAVETYEDFVKVLRDELRAVIPFEIGICGLGYITSNGTVQAHKLISLDFPVDYLKAISTEDGGFTSPKMANWMHTRSPQLFEDYPESSFGMPTDWLAILRQFGIRNIASHGVHDTRGNCTSYFAFCNLPERLTDERHTWLLKMVVPTLHAALLKVIEQVPFLGIESSLHGIVLSPREVELLQWVAAGKKRQEIAKGLCLSENTVRNHLSHLYSKLGVHKAVEAIERAKILHIL